MIDLVERAVAAAVDAALGEVVRQGGALGHIAREARSAGIHAAGVFVEALDKRTLDAVERDHIARVLALCGGNISEAARRLGLYRSSLQRKLRRLGVR